MKITRCLVTLLAAVLVACGNEQTGQGGAPPDSSVTISPSSIAWTAPASSSETERQRFTITVRNNAGNPVQGANVDIFLDLSAGTSTSVTMILLDSTLTPQPSPFRTQTDNSGNITVHVDIPVGGGLEYRGFLQAFTGAAFNNAEISVSCEDC